MPKPHLWLIFVWTIVCASGLAVFLFQIYKPILPVSADDPGVGISVVFWIIAWLAPTLVIAMAGRRRKG